MSRTTPPGRKLGIKKETLRRLDASQLGRVVAGIAAPTHGKGGVNDTVIGGDTGGANTTTYCKSEA